MTDHVLRKAGYKKLYEGQAVSLSRSAKLKIWTEGNTAEDRYHRAAYEAKQRVSMVSIAEEFRHGVVEDPAPFDLINNAAVTSRFARQDNVRFNKELGSKKQHGLRWRDRLGVKLSRQAHYANGVTELGAAPTGMLLKFSKLFCTPKLDDRSMSSQIRALLFLGPIAALVSVFGINTLGRIAGAMVAGAGEMIKNDIKTIVGSFSALSAGAAMFSLLFSAASAHCLKNLKLNAAQANQIHHNNQTYLNNLYKLLSRARESSGFRRMVAIALCKKIPQQYCSQTASTEPLLLTELLRAIEGKSLEEARPAIARVLGAYQSLKSLDRLASTEPLTSADLLDRSVDKKECLARENHVIALTNLIEHNRIAKDEHDHYRDVRTWCDKGVSFMGAKAHEKCAPAGHVARDDKAKSPIWDRYLRSAGDSILKNSRQYGTWTVALARCSEALRAFNHGVVLSLNYQLTRPIAWLTGRITEYVLKEPNSRTVSFSVGRLFASSIWAVLDALLIISPAAGNGIGFGGPEAKTSLPFPLQIPFGAVTLPISIVSTAAQMIVVGVPALGLMALAKVAFKIEGWKGSTKIELAEYRKQGRSLVTI
ncbi:MAG TPA: hypothetical protein VFV39_11760 [Limnobacter sp.]|nr:hypothetical protein [Limnobacter sp.]